MAISLTSLGVNVDRLAHAQIGPTTTTLYTAPGTPGTRARVGVSAREICNPSPSDLAVRLGIIPQGGTSDGSHFLLGGQVVKANTTLVIDTTLFLRPGDILEAYSDPLPAPVLATITGATTGGSLAATTYYYKLTSTNLAGETVGSNELVVTTTGTTSSVALTWARSLGASGYKLYRGTTVGGENALVATIASGATLAYTDTGAATTAVSPPATGTAAGCIFTISGAELPA